MIDHLDRLVIAIANESAYVDFYTRVLGTNLVLNKFMLGKQKKCG